MDEHSLQLFWLTVSLLVIIALAVWKGRKAIQEGFKAKIAEIALELKQAEQLKEEAQQTLAEYKRKQREALAQAEEIVEEARREADRLQAIGREKLEASLSRREAQAMEKIAQAEQAAILEVRHKSVDLATEAASKILADRMSGEDGDRMVEEAIEDLGKKLH